MGTKTRGERASEGWVEKNVKLYPGPQLDAVSLLSVLSTIRKISSLSPSRLSTAHTRSAETYGLSGPASRVFYLFSKCRVDPRAVRPWYRSREGRGGSLDESTLVACHMPRARTDALSLTCVPVPLPPRLTLRPRTLGSIWRNPRVLSYFAG